MSDEKMSDDEKALLMSFADNFSDEQVRIMEIVQEALTAQDVPTDTTDIIIALRGLAKLLELRRSIERSAPHPDDLAA